MLELIKLTNVKHLLEVVSNKEAFFQLLVTILQLNSPGLISLFKNLFEHIRQPPSVMRRIKEDQLAPKTPEETAETGGKISEKKQQLIEDNLALKSLLEHLVSHVQLFLRWLIELGLEPELAKIHAH